MMCQSCGKAEATTHVKKIINGEATEAHLCSDCSVAMGFNDVFGGFGFNFADILGDLFKDTSVSALSAHAVRCDKCGSSFNDIIKSGKIGCADCYETFYDKLLPSVQRIHGKTKHEGKVPLNVVTNIEEETPKFAQLKEMLNEAIKAENFEEAAKLRDEIKQMEGNNNNG